MLPSKRLNSRKSKRKDELTAHLLKCFSPQVLSHVITCLGIKRYQFTGRDMPLQNSSGVALFGVLTGM